VDCPVEIAAGHGLPALRWKREVGGPQSKFLRNAVRIYRVAGIGGRGHHRIEPVLRSVLIPRILRDTVADRTHRRRSSPEAQS
jgi:hypothetical protein